MHMNMFLQICIAFYMYNLQAYSYASISIHEKMKTYCDVLGW
jgi:hypothetical protein